VLCHPWGQCKMGSLLPGSMMSNPLCMPTICRVNVVWRRVSFRCMHPPPCLRRWWWFVDVPGPPDVLHCCRYATLLQTSSLTLTLLS
jgi:hypothetical protein